MRQDSPQKAQRLGNNVSIKRVQSGMSISSIKWSPNDYQAAAVVAAEVGNDLLDRLSLMTIEPAVVLDLGCGTGELTKKLKTRYPEAKILGMDISREMLDAMPDFPVSVIQADAHQLPLASQSVDLVVGNFLLPWCEDGLAVLKECHRILKPQGVLIFTALGPDTMQEYRDYIEKAVHPHIIDMHNLGDELVQLGFADPVLDVDYYTTTYRNQEKLLAELKNSGMLLIGDDIKLPVQHNEWSVTYEIIHGHSWMPPESDHCRAGADGTVSIPLSILRKQLRSG